MKARRVIPTGFEAPHYIRGSASDYVGSDAIVWLRVDMATRTDCAERVLVLRVFRHPPQGDLSQCDNVLFQFAVLVPQSCELCFDPRLDNKSRCRHF